MSAAARVGWHLGPRWVEMGTARKVCAPPPQVLEPKNAESGPNLPLPRDQAEAGRDERGGGQAP